MFEYVPKSEYKPLQDYVENIIKKVQKNLREKGILTFQFYRLGSSGKRQLITRDKNGNKGFDFDYNIEIQKIKNQDFYEPKLLKNLFIREFNTYFSSNYECAEDSTSVFTIKDINKSKSKILHSFDFAIVENKYDDKGRLRQRYIRFDKNTGGYSWALRKLNKNHSDIEYSIKSKGLWNQVRDLYLKNKNKEPNKKSRIVYYQTLETIYRRNFQ